MSKREKLVFISILLFIVIFVSYDVWSDLKAGSSLTHMTAEAAVIIIAGFGALRLLFQNFFLKHEMQSQGQELKELKLEASKWKQENQTLISGLSQAIDKQMEDWAFTPSEKEVALLLLKGLSFKEVSTIRESTEKTIRHHAQKIYEKSNLAGRAELSAFFLEDLLVRQ